MPSVNFQAASEVLEKADSGLSPPKCTWIADGDFWRTDCDQGFIFNDGGPGENKFVYCPYCGKAITEKAKDPDDR